MLPDVIDSACEQEQMATERYVALQRALAAPEQYPYPDGSWPTTTCVDCDEPIEEGRLELGKTRCYACQEAKEKRAARGLR